MGLLAPGETFTAMPLEGGVSSDIVRIDLPGRTICVKRALGRLKVAADWRAPVERNRYEVAWMRVAATIEPDAVPAILGEDRDAGCFAMAYLDPAGHPVWKAQLRGGTIEPALAAAVGSRIAAIHAATAGDAIVAQAFATDHILRPIRIEPYLIATARRHPDCARALEALARDTADTRLALVHGDVSPKNILVGPRGPVFLDAECAWYGDPAFDAAFCLNHLLLKGAWQPQWRDRYLACFAALADAYLAGATWERRDALEARIAALLPGLLLGRVDGKSPVEYLTEAGAKDRVRRFARRFLLDPVEQLTIIAKAWSTA